MSFTPFFVGIMPFPGVGEGSRHYDNALVAWQRELRHLEKTITSQRMYTEHRVGNSYRWSPVRADGVDTVFPKRQSHAFPGWQEILVGLSSPALAILQDFETLGYSQGGPQDQT